MWGSLQYQSPEIATKLENIRVCYRFSKKKGENWYTNKTCMILQSYKTENRIYIVDM